MVTLSHRLGSEFSCLVHLTCSCLAAAEDLPSSGVELSLSVSMQKESLIEFVLLFRNYFG